MRLAVLSPSVRTPVLVFALACLLPACSTVSEVKLWPFGDKQQERRVRVDGTEYQCAGNKRFYVRMLDGGSAAWVILPEREFRLEKQSANRYGNGNAVLELNAAEASLNDGPGIALTGCKPPASPAA